MRERGGRVCKRRRGEKERQRRSITHSVTVSTETDFLSSILFFFLLNKKRSGETRG
jgi:hypothetical protein